MEVVMVQVAVRYTADIRANKYGFDRPSCAGHLPNLDHCACEYPENRMGYHRFRTEHICPRNVVGARIDPQEEQ